MYSVGAKKPDVSGLIDLNSNKPGFALDEETLMTAKPIFLNTGRLVRNPEAEEL